MSEMSEGAAQPIRLFYSYAREDDVFRQALDKHLSALKRTGVIAPWHDRRIAPGGDWAHEIDKHLEDAHLILLLVSADFLASDYCWGVEMEKALEMHKAGLARVIPVMVRPVDIEGVPFANLQALPREAKPITEWRNLDTAWADVAKGIRVAAQDLRNRPRPRAAPVSVVPKPESADEKVSRRPERMNAQMLGDLYKAYWTRFNEAFQGRGLALRPPTPSSGNHVRISLRSGDKWIHAFVSVRDRYLGVELVLWRPGGTYEKLKASKGEIEREMGRGLDWKEARDSNRIVLVEKGYDPADRADWPRQHNLLIQNIELFQHVLLKRI